MTAGPDLSIGAIGASEPALGPRMNSIPLLLTVVVRHEGGVVEVNADRKWNAEKPQAKKLIRSAPVLP